MYAGTKQRTNIQNFSYDLQKIHHISWHWHHTTQTELKHIQVKLIDYGLHNWVRGAGVLWLDLRDKDTVEDGILQQDIFTQIILHKVYHVVTAYCLMYAFAVLLFEVQMSGFDVTLYVMVTGDGVTLYVMVSGDGVTLYVMVSGDGVTLYVMVSGDGVTLYVMVSGDGASLYVMVSGDSVTL